MQKKIQFTFLFIALILAQLNFAQDKKPKVALVLSGGGAKGIAHIPLLQTLDSLGIVPDLIVGTSMGSIAGALYAMGYSGDSIAQISLHTDWANLFGGGISLRDVSVEEKSEFSKYLIEFDWVDGKPKLSPSLLNDQNLREFFSSLTYPVYNIDDFDDLAIPFRAMATDIVNGKEVIMSKGSLSKAMRSSMSIPSIFAPVPYKDVLLIDGGVLNNFPTDVAKKWGADIIIGSDIGSGMEPIEKLGSIPVLLAQTSMLTSNLKDAEHRSYCDILIDHVPYLTYSTADFGKSLEIYNEGKLAVIPQKNALIALAEKLKKYKQKVPSLPVMPNRVIIDSVVFKGLSKANYDIVKERVNIIPHHEYSFQDLIKGINRAMGTSRFSQIMYNPIVDGDKIGLEFHLIEKAEHQIKAALHYDTYRGAGILLNYTGRNVLGNNSRFLINADIAEQPSMRAQYQLNFGDKKDWWWKTESMWQKLKQQFYIEGEKIEVLDSKYFNIDNQINKNLNSLRSYVGFGVNYEVSRLKPEVDPDINESVFLLDKYKFKNLEITAQYLYNGSDKVFFPTNGTFFNARLSRSLLHDINVTFSDPDIPEIDGKTNGYTKLALNFEHRHSFNKKTTGIIGVNTGFTFMDNLKDDEVAFSDFGFADKYYLGGNLIRPRTDDYIFPGLNESELIVSQFMMLKIGVQYTPISNLYFTPHFHLSSVGQDNFDEYIKNAFNPKGNWQDGIGVSSLVSAGLSTSYNSILGPINFDVSWVNNINKVRLFFSVGIQFNRTN